MRCQRRAPRAAVGATMAALALAAGGCAPRQPVDTLGPPSALPEALARGTRLTRHLCHDLGLAPPLAVEMAAVPDLSRGLSYSSVIRLQPAPFPRLLSTLFHETGHSGPVRDREVEEAIADLARRALVHELARQQPALAAGMIPDLLLGVGHAARRVTADAAGARVDAIPLLYDEAARLAAALLADVTSSCDEISPQACRAAHGARLGRTLTSAEVRRLADARMPRSRWPAQARQALSTDLPLLVDTLAQDRRVPKTDQERLVALSVLLRHLNTPPVPFDRFEELSLLGNASDRQNGYVVISKLAGDPGRPLRFLGRWLSATDSSPEPGERGAVLTYRALLRQELNDRAGARADLTEVVLEAEYASQAAFALVRLARMDGLGADDLERWLDLAPALRAAGPAGAELRGHILAEAGHPVAALPYFARAAGRAQGWTLTIGWAEALAAAGHRESAAALLVSRADVWRRAGDDARAGAALLAAVEMDSEPQADDALLAAEVLERIGAFPDRALAIAARLLETSGRCNEALALRRHLAIVVPGSDHVGAPPAAGSPCAD